MWKRPQARRRRYIDNGTAARAHDSSGRQRQDPHAGQIERDHVVEVFDRPAVELLDTAAARVIEQDVELSEACDDSGDESLTGLRVPDVRHDYFSLPAERTD